MAKRIRGVKEAVGGDGVKREDIEKCVLCNKGVMHSGDILFYMVKIIRFGVDIKAVQRQHGFDELMPGSPVLANVMGPNEDIAVPIGEPDEALVCDKCAMETMPLAALHERIANKKEKGSE